LTLNPAYLVMLTVTGVIVLGIIILGAHQNLEENRTKIEAQKIIDFRNTDHSCIELKKLYNKLEPKKYNSFLDHDWYNEVRDKLISNECISDEDLNNREFINICIDGKTMGCNISKLENPELYENFKGVFPDV